MNNEGQQSSPNNLVDEKSPYLLQHAYNPVNWFPWGETAFNKAKDEDKPIFLSIGYATCHWCHVMERESFEDDDVAKLLNDSFVSIKVDREERPDIDSIYMKVCQMMTQRGGWPLTIIMTPDKKPFFAGTYFPKFGRGGMIGIIDLLTQIVKLWDENRAEILSSTKKILSHLEESASSKLTSYDTDELFTQAFTMLSNQFDDKRGGFGSAPKFPSTHRLLFLLRYWKRYKDKSALEMVEKTLSEMRLGGMYDHLGYGFHRYSTDENWKVPHFEKMLYDQAMIILAYTETYQATKNVNYKKTSEEIINKHGKARTVIVRNVLPHVANLHDFVQGLQMCLEDDGLLAIEFHYAAEIFEELHYDSIYHEHLCYFTLKSIENLLNRYGIHVYDIKESRISGGSLILYAKKKKEKETDKVTYYRDLEEKNGINDLDSWQDFAEKVRNHRKQLLEILKDTMDSGGNVVGYGASARSSTLLNYCEIDSRYISMIADQNELKHNHYTAGTHIPISSPQIVMKNNPDYVFILAWNFKDEIIEKLKNDFNFKGKCILPLPNNPKIVECEVMKNMNIKENKIKGVFEINLDPHEDHRGFFMRTYDDKTFKEHGIHHNWVQENHSFSRNKGTLRGLHFQFPPHAETKLVRAVSGEIFMAFVDLRKDSLSPISEFIYKLPPTIKFAATACLLHSDKFCHQILNIHQN